ncbi:TM2 domain-containing protein [Candidatus Saccharibacteria bacterium]|nr:TM2 domain-containing protein [Candidatus Saccharibacteria bacterium]
MDNQPSIETQKQPEQSTKAEPSKKTLLIAALLAFFPLTGAWGVHDIITKRYKSGIAHISVMATIYIIWMIYSLNQKIFNSQFMIFFSNISYFIMVISYILAIIEGIQILANRNKKTEETLSLAVNSIATPQTKNNKSVESAVVSSDVHEVAYYKAGNLDDVRRKMIEEEARKKRENPKYNIKAYSIIAFIAATIPLLPWTYCLIVSGGSFNEGGAGAVWWLMVMYYWSIGIPLAIVSICFAIAGLKTKYKALATISIVIKIVTIITIICIFAIPNLAK